MGAYSPSRRQDARHFCPRAGGIAAGVAVRLPDGHAAFGNGILSRAVWKGPFQRDFIGIFQGKNRELFPELLVVRIDAGRVLALVVGYNGFLLVFGKLHPAHRHGDFGPCWPEVPAFLSIISAR